MEVRLWCPLTEKCTGYTNLSQNMEQQKKFQVHTLKEAVNLNLSTLDSYFSFSKKYISIHGWLDIIVLTLSPIKTVKNAVTRKHVRHEFISFDTVIKYLHKLMYHTEFSLTTVLPDSFSILHDGWSDGDTKYLCLFASFSAPTANLFGTSFLVFSPMDDETNLGVEEHCKLLKFSLVVYSKNMINVLFLIGDTCNGNKAVSHRLSLPFIGYLYHRFNVDVSHILDNYYSSIKQVRSIIMKRKNLIPAAKCR